MRHSIFLHTHVSYLNHTGVRATRRIIGQKFLKIQNVDIGKWAARPVNDQRYRATVSPPGIFSAYARFEHIHLDINGPLLSSAGMQDRYTRCPEEQPMADIKATICTEALCQTWISPLRFQARITTTDQLESGLFQQGLSRFTLGFQ